MYITEQRQTLVIDSVDLCVLGGSCTGVFAAVRAARLGLRVCIVEKQNCFGGTATSGLVNMWHSIYDAEYKRQIIGGLTTEMLDRLSEKGELITSPESRVMFTFNSEELKIELDKMVLENKITPYLHTFFCDAFVEDGAVKGVFVENKDGRGLIRSKLFIDCTGDGDLMKRLGVSDYDYGKNMQPPSPCAKIHIKDASHVYGLIKAHRDEFGLQKDWGWNSDVPVTKDIKMFALTHIFGVDCSKAKNLTFAEMEGRRQIDAVMNILRRYGKDEKASLAALYSYIGIRETVHFKSLHRVTDEELLSGKTFGSAVCNGAYPVDIHMQDGSTVLKYLDGTQTVNTPDGKICGRWREGAYVTPFWQIPYETLLNEKYTNVVCAGRMVDAEEGAFSAIRVMVNLNQLGEAAGTAAALAVQSGNDFGEVDRTRLRKALSDGGSIII